jgi:hypothetical protein
MSKKRVLVDVHNVSQTQCRKVYMCFTKEINLNSGNTNSVTCEKEENNTVRPTHFYAQKYENQRNCKAIVIVQKSSKAPHHEINWPPI